MDESRLKAFVARFLVQLEETMPRVTRAILALERPPPEAPLRPSYETLARDLHGVKGTAAMLGLKGPSELAHRMEDVVVARRDANAALGTTAADRLLEACDAFVACVRARAAGEPVSDLADVIARVTEQVVGDPGAAAFDPPTARRERKTDEGARSGRGDSAPSGWRVDAAQVEALLRAVDRIRELCQRMDDHARQAHATLDATQTAETDELRDSLSHLARGLASTSREANDAVQGLDDALRDLATTPVASILEPMHRAVRELCRQHGKEARLALVGGEHAVDRRLLEAVSPLVGHLLRNAVDHGLESPADRERSGKDPVGVISVRVEQQGNLVMVEVSDDGAGIDVDLVGRSAVSKGILSEEERAELGTQQVMRLVFEDGLSTRSAVTETSGRGVGLAAVRREVERLGGHVDVTSQAGQGTRFLIALSAAFGSTSVVVVRVGGRLVAVPLGAILTAKGANPAELELAAGGFTMIHNEERIAARDLGALLGLRAPRPPQPGQPLFVVGTTAGRAAIAVDEALGDREIVLRALPLELREVPAYHGIGVLAQRDIVLVCNPEWLVHPGPEAPA